jgi:hypothetical protein
MEPATIKKEKDIRENMMLIKSPREERFDWKIHRGCLKLGWIWSY